MEKFHITWHYTNKIVNDLIKINRAKEIVDFSVIPVFIEEEFIHEAMNKMVHYSTKIEGNNLSLKEVIVALESNGDTHERNVLEVRNYYNALVYLNNLSINKTDITENLILKVHNLVIGKSLKYKNSFRDGQNAVFDSVSNAIVYLPPEAKDVKSLIHQMINEYKNNEDIPIPIKAGIFAYQFVTIHPFWDGNGRCARLLANYILKVHKFDLKGFYVLEEVYDKNIKEYYDSLQMGLHHNFYFGRKDADITEWLEYFISTMATTFEFVGSRVKDLYESKKTVVSIIDTMDKRERWVANYIINNGKIRAKDIANHFKVNLDTANNWIKKWLENDFLCRYDNEQKRNIEYILTARYHDFLV